jgi:hypothetical protein
VEALQLLSNTQSHWTSGSTVCSPPRWAAVHAPGMHLQWEPGSPVSDVSLQVQIIMEPSPRTLNAKFEIFRLPLSDTVLMVSAT